jgi:glycine/D-amino acid oxidase-like deaminating enzyme
MKIIVIGAGIIGALTAFRLARSGAEVTVIDAGQPAGAASGASFGWLNASFYLDEDHYRFRVAGLEAHRRLAEDLETQAIRWPGSLVWEAQGQAFERQRDALAALGYAVREVDRAEFIRLQPEILAPERALHFAQEGVADLPALARDTLRAASALGARLLAGLAATGIDTHGNRVLGVRTPAGAIAADRVVIAGGIGCPALLEGVGVKLPMLRRPGLILRSSPMPPLLTHVLASPAQELRQDADGCLLAPTSAGHQGDASESLEADPVALADATATRVAGMIGRPVAWAQVTLAMRPVPGDGLPVVGACGPEGLYVSTMHSGATLAAIAAELAAAEITGARLGDGDAALLAPYRPLRFA